MLFRPTPLQGAYLIDLEQRVDQRGFFSRFFCEKEFAQAELESKFIQINNSFTNKKGTLRGMHYQVGEAAEVKLVRCLQGALYDVIIDLRSHSPTYKKWFGAELNADNRTMMYVPRGFAHGFVTLADHTEALYLVSTAYSPENERGLRFDDPAIGIEWPIKEVETSEKDQNWPAFDPEWHSVHTLMAFA